MSDLELAREHFARRTFKLGGARWGGHATAVTDPAEVYRYRLTRSWGPGPHAGWVMLNPSTALADEDDATIRKCVGFAHRWGCHGIVVVNLFAFRASDPTMLEVAGDPVGPENRAHLEHLFHDPVVGDGPVVAGWGNWPARAMERWPLLDVALGSGPLRCLGTTKSGAPRHPGRLGYDTPLVHYKGA